MNPFLLGNRGDYELEVGPKVLLVASGGTLELHGRKKLSWTKLDKTVRKVDNSDALLYDHIVSKYAIIFYPSLRKFVSRQIVFISYL